MHPFPTPWKHQKTVRFSDVFRWKRKGVLGMNGLKKTAVSWLEISVEKAEHESISNGSVCFTDIFFRK